MINKENHHFYREALNHTNIGLMITDPNLPDHPIIFVNKGFVNMTGYQEEEVVGKNSRMLQGDSTDPAIIMDIKQAIKEKRSTTVEIYNYTKKGKGFWNELTIDPMWIGDKLYFVGVQKDITKLKEKERLLNEALNEMTQLSTPIVPIDDHISALPLIGSMDRIRLDHLTEKISTYLAETKVDYLIIDLSGLHSVDPTITDTFIKLSDLTQLIGSRLVITGVRPDLAFMARDLGGQLKDLHTYLTIQDAIKALS